MKENVMEEWIEEVWLQRANHGTSEETALILDSAKCHLTDKAKAAVNATAKMAVIPGGLTKKTSTLDISVNKSFKNKLQTQWEQWMIDTNSYTYTKSGQMRHATYLEVCNWIIKSWKEVTPTCIMNGFRKSLNADADEDEEEENLDNELSDFESLPGNILDALDHFNFISDKEFEGLTDQ
uniref:DDE-1 domain-containing protein n=1 Tax=Acrobeloides nanus TaxID=290746 RepID=A0A914CLE3_9BILA